MSLSHFLMAMSVCALWGTNFVAIKTGLTVLPPLFFTALRFFLVAIPMIFFVKRPKVPLKIILAFTFFYCMLKFSLMFLGLSFGVDGGLASLVVQMQVFFTLGFSYLLHKEKLSLSQLFALSLGVMGLVLIGVDMHTSANIIGLICIIFSALAWGFSNHILQKVGKQAGFSFVIWTHSLSSIPLLFLSLIFEDVNMIMQIPQKINFDVILSILYTSYIATLIGATLWAHLIKNNGASKIAPYTMAIPAFGIISCSFILGERLSPIAGVSCLLIFVALVWNERINYLSRKKKKIIMDPTAS